MAKRRTPPTPSAASPPRTRPLAGRVAVVAGATRGAGRGIARALGEAGATVYCTGRSVRGNPSPYHRPETIEETADLVTAGGGVGIAVRVDHAVEAEVKALFERVEREQERLDVLADSVAGEDPLFAGWMKPFWETDLSNGVAALRQGLFSHVITAKHAAPLMIKQRRGLIVEVVEGDLLFSSGTVLCQLIKFGLKGLAASLAEDLRKHRVAAVTITPGFLRSESMLEHFGVTEENWRDAGEKDLFFLQSESPLFVGRAVAALARDAKVMARSGDLLSSWQVGREFDLTDYDGRRPDWGKFGMDEVVRSMKWIEDGLRRHLTWLERFVHRAKGYLTEA